jgi:iron complex outermembrane receptor protein
MIRRELLSTTVAAGLGGLALLGASAAAAQSDAADAKPATPVEELVITGSRIRHTEFTSPSPVQIVSVDQARQKGLTGAASILQHSTVAAGSVQINNQLSQFVVDGGIGIESVSLRGLGSQRTLVLLNGRRVSPAGVGGTVGSADLQVIPQAMVDRYEILKDGASSIYGSDAVGGVVNIITRDRYDGLTLEANADVAQRGAGTQYDIALTWGRVRDNYHLLGGLEYVTRSPIREGDLPGGDCPHELQHAPGQPGYGYGRVNPDGSPYCDFIQTDFVTTFLNPGTWVFDSSAGAAFPFAPFVQDAYPDVPRRTNIATDPRERGMDALAGANLATANLMGGFDLSPRTELYFEALASYRSNDINVGTPALFPASEDEIVSVSLNPFNPFSDYVQPVMTLPVQRAMADVGAGRGVIGLRGDLPFVRPGWKFDTYVTYSVSHGQYMTDPVIASRVANALDVVPVPDGYAAAPTRRNPVDGLNYTCRVNLGSPAERCVPINWFEGSRALAGDPVLSYIRVPDRGHTNYREIVYNASANGPVAELPAGALQAAVGMEFRYDKLRDVPGPLARARDYYGQSTAGITEGDDTTWAGFAEVDAPLLRGLPLVESLTANVSARYTDQRIAGSDWTYKLGGEWQLIPELRIRGTYGTSFRGPALFENYLAAQTSFTGARDPCQTYDADLDPASTRYKNCAAEGLPPNFPGYPSTPEVLTQGAQGRLRPETSRNLTVGVQWQPAWAELQVGVDYFHIEVNDEIATLGAGNLLSLCYDSPQFRNGSPYCQLIAPRDANGGIASIDDSYLNIASQITAGFDVTLNYRRQFRAGELSFEGQATYTTTDSSELIPGTGQTSYNGTFGDPRLVFNTGTRFRHKQWTFLWSTTFLSKQQQYGLTGETEGGRYKLHQESQLYHTVSVTYEGDRWKGTVGIRNLLDDYPPFISSNPYPAYAPRIALYGAGTGNLELFGRTFFVNLRKEF